MVQNKYSKTILSSLLLSMIFAFLFWGGIFSLTSKFNIEWLVFSALVAIIIVSIYYFVFRYLATKYDYIHEHEFLWKPALVSFVAGALLHLPIAIVSRERLNDNYTKKYITPNYGQQKEGYIYLLGSEIYLLFFVILLFLPQNSFISYVFFGGAIFAFWQIAPLVSFAYVKIKAVKTPYLWLLLLYFLWFFVLLSKLLQKELAIFVFFALVFSVLYMVYYKIPNI